MPSTDSSRAGALMPISLSMAGDTVDMSVPSNIALAELVPVLVKAVSPLDPGTATRGFTIRTSDGNVLSQSKTLPEQKVRPGAVLTLEPMGSNSQDQRYDDLVEAVGTAVADKSTPWERTNSVQLSAHASAALVLLAALLLLTGAHEPTLTAAVGASGALLTTLAAAVVARMPNRPGALSLGHTTPVLVACAAFAITAGDWFSLPLAASGVGLLAGSCTLLVLPSDLRVSMAAPITTGFSLVLVGGLVNLAGVAPERAASLTLSLLVVVTLSAPWVAMAQIPIGIGTSQENEKIDTPRVYSRVDNARVLVISLKAGCSAAMVVLAPLMTTSPVAIAMLACSGVALMLTTRSLRSAVEVLIGVLTGMFLTILAAVSTTTVAPDALPWTLGAIILTAVLLLTANVVSQRLRPWLTRLADAAGVLALLGILPLAALVWGVI
ncbi:MAG: secretion system protein EccD [Propionibacterium sp.]|jgi:hypothetical protein|nr:secretion system protein EccD [Propionibacterium sp.]MDO4646036.1 EsaB/YukD family protein [Propionibacteriaceae bacterium]